MNLLLIETEDYPDYISERFHKLFNETHVIHKIQSILDDEILEDIKHRNIQEINYNCILILINSECNFAFRLAFSIRLKKLYGNKPIIILSAKGIHDYNDTDLIEIQKFLHNEYSNIHFKQIQDFKDPQFNITKFIKGHSKKVSISEIIEHHQITDPHKGDDRHSITNEWGVIQLASHFGYSCQDISYKVPEGLHYLYLQKKDELENKSEENLLTLLKNEREDIYQLIKKECCLINNNQISLSELGFEKILLIDDNAKKGWENLLNKIFGVKVETILNLDNAEDIDFNQFDLIFLDYKLPKNDDDSKLLPSTDLLESIKEKSPATPVIIFTASNKYKKIQECINLGADGVYIKISPENIGQKTREQTLKFVSLLYEISITYKHTLTPLYQYIDDLPNHHLSIIKNHNTGYDVSRIDERLKMFYKTLKNEYIFSEFEQKSDFISHLEISFLILWSVLNEIQNVLFKGESWKDYLDANGIAYDKKIKDFNEWIDIYRNKKYLEASYGYDRHHRCIDVKFKENFVKFFKISEQNKYSPGIYINSRDNCTITISRVISFLIFNRQNSTEKDTYFEEIVRINKIRNNLFLIHGKHIIYTPESELPEFLIDYQLDQKHEISVNTTEIKESILSLLNIISFLLTDNVKLKIDPNKIKL